MTAVTICSWVAVVAVLAAYATHRQRLFAWSNVLLCIPIALPTLLAGVYAPFTISLAFGVISLVYLLRGREVNADND
jgi:ABC-type spermidine/putrescine transport system permease subunit II